MTDSRCAIHRCEEDLRERSGPRSDVEPLLYALSSERTLQVSNKELALYKEEGIEVAVSFCPDNSECIKLLSARPVSAVLCCCSCVGHGLLRKLRTLGRRQAPNIHAPVCQAISEHETRCSRTSDDRRFCAAGRRTSWHLFADVVALTGIGPLSGRSYRNPGQRVPRA